MRFDFIQRALKIPCTIIHNYIAQAPIFAAIFYQVFFKISAVWTFILFKIGMVKSQSALYFERFGFALAKIFWLKALWRAKKLVPTQLGV